MRRALLIFSGVICASLALAAGPPKAPTPGAKAAPRAAPGKQPEPPMTEPIVVEGVDWHPRAQKWFQAAAEDEKARRKEMKAASQALRQPCKYCHTKEFDGFVDARLKRVTQQMMALSVEHGVPCAKCHLGKGAYTELGEESKPMWELCQERKVFCDECHQPGHALGKLTAEGKKQRDVWAKERESE